MLILSVRDDPDEKVAALDAGADDYVTKPFNTAELLARLRVIQRRSLAESGEPIFECGGLRVDLAARRVTFDGAEVKLTATEYGLLRTLVQHAGKVVTHKQLLRSVWGEKAENQARSLPRSYYARAAERSNNLTALIHASSRLRPASAIDSVLRCEANASRLLPFMFGINFTSDDVHPWMPCRSQATY